MYNDDWGRMEAASWHPSQWFYDDDPPHLERQKGIRAMWVYQRSEAGLWSVGYYGPDKAWHPESDWESKEDAAKRVHWLNGGQGQVSAA